MNKKICISKKIGYLSFFLIGILVYVIFGIVLNQNKVSLNTKASELAKPTDIKTIYANPSNLLEKVNEINNNPNQKYRLLLYPGNYTLNNSLKKAPATSVSGFGYVDTKVAIKIENIKYLEVNSTNYYKKIVKPVVHFEGETGLYFSNIGNLILKNIHVKGGKVRQYNDPAGVITYEKQVDIGIGPYDALRSQVLIENTPSVYVHNVTLEGVGLGKDYVPDGAAGVRGLTVIANNLKSVTSIQKSEFINNTWDSILLIGDIDAKANDLTLSRSGQQISDDYIPVGATGYLVKSFSGVDGSGIAALKNAYVELSNTRFNGYHKVIGLNSSRGGKITNVSIRQPLDWNLKEAYLAYWPLWILDGSDTSNKGDLIIQNFNSYDPNTITEESAKEVPYYTEWLAGLFKLNSVTIDGLYMSHHSFPVEITYPNKVSSYFAGFPGQNVSLRNWKIVVIKREESGRIYPEFEKTFNTLCLINCSISKPEFLEFSFPKGQ